MAPPFDDDNRGEPLTPPTRHIELVPGDELARAATAGFCKSLSPEDWILLEQLGPRLRSALLKQTVAIALCWRKRRGRRL